ncbi:MAG: hypothetical protein IKC71_04035 [Clostridia bacterium]|nr:hypothetical protein [Clostridia bacterium]
MKKRFFKILITVCLALSVCLTAVGCRAPFTLSLTNPGDVIENAGFVAETENYIYFINGVEESSKENKYGTPVKGSLMVADKTDLSKAEIAVPKLFVANDYTAGLYIFDGSIYYATPTTQKNTSGEVAFEYVDFCKSTLDGKETETYFSVIGTVLEYRIVEVEEVVYIVYFDGNLEELAVFNTATKEKTVIKEKVTDFYFLPSDMVEDFIVAYSVTTEKDWTSEEETPSTYAYNEVYGYSIKEGSKKILDGNGNGLGSISYAITGAYNGYVFYTATETYETDADLQTKYYGVKAGDLWGAGKEKATLLNASAKDYLVVTSYVVSPSEVYFVEDGFIVKEDLTVEALTNKQIVAKANFSEVDFIYNGYIYGKTSDNQIARVELGEERAQIVAENVKLDWYDYKIVDGKLFFIDAEYGVNNVSYVEVDNAVVKEETDDDGEVTKTYLDGKTAIGKLSEEDNLTLANAYMKELVESGEITFAEGEETEVKLNKVLDAYEVLTKKQQKTFDKENEETIENYKKALEVSKLLIKLEGFENAETDDARDAFEADYTNARKAIDELLKDTDNQPILDLLVENGRWYLQQAGRYFA